MGCIFSVFISLQENFNFREKKFVENIVMSVFCCIFVCRNTPQYPILLFVCYQEPCGEPWMTTVPVEGRGPSDVQIIAMLNCGSDAGLVF